MMISSRVEYITISAAISCCASYRFFKGVEISSRNILIYKFFRYRKYPKIILKINFETSAKSFVKKIVTLG